jgi:hypothetical protein
LATGERGAFEKQRRGGFLTVHHHNCTNTTDTPSSSSSMLFSCWEVAQEHLQPEVRAILVLFQCFMTSTKHLEVIAFPSTLIKSEKQEDAIIRGDSV